MNVEIEERGDGGWGDLGTRREGDEERGRLGDGGDGETRRWGMGRLGDEETWGKGNSDGVQNSVRVLELFFCIEVLYSYYGCGVPFFV